jgi:hypothetical protein
MNDKRNLICGNVMLLSQSCGEISLSTSCKKKMFDLIIKNVFKSKDCWLTRPYDVVAMLWSKRNYNSVLSWNLIKSLVRV